jgi:putative endonuclease
MSTLDKGRFGEYLAKRFVMAKGMDILAMNYRTGRYELDIIAMEGDEVVFIEVKRRKSSFVYTVNEAITWAKRSALAKAAMQFFSENEIQHLTGRFDVVYLEESPNGEFGLDYIKNAFY